MSNNPYLLSADAVLEPPTTLLGSIRHLGPGLILSASIVGSGELIATTVMGAEAGFVTLWVILVSCLVKVAIQLEFGRHTIATGETTMEAFNQLPGPKFGKAHCSIWIWLVHQPDPDRAVCFSELWARELIERLHRGFTGRDRVPTEFKLNGDFYQTAHQNHPQRDKACFGAHYRCGN